MIKIKLATHEKVLNVFLTILMFAILITEGTPLLLGYIASHALPVWVFWLASIATITGAPKVYLMLSSDYTSSACCD